MQIKKNNVAYVWPYDPFSGNAVNLRRGNADCHWDSVGIGPENFSRTAVVTNTAELALDAPFDDPNGKMCLEAGHRLLLSHLGARHDERISDIQENETARTILRKCRPQSRSMAKNQLITFLRSL